MRPEDYGTMVLRYVVRDANWWKKRRASGKGDPFCLDRKLSFSQEIRFPMGALPLDMRLIDIFRCAWSVSRFLRTCILHIYIYKRIYSLRTDKCTRRELDLSFFQLIAVPFIFSNPKVICIAYRFAFIDCACFCLAETSLSIAFDRAFAVCTIRYCIT